MPNQAEFTFEPQAVFTGCICPNVRQGLGIHEPGCPTQPFIPKKPTPYAARREWKRYHKLTSRRS